MVHSLRLNPFSLQCLSSQHTVPTRFSPRGPTRAISLVDMGGIPFESERSVLRTWHEADGKRNIAISPTTLRSSPKAPADSWGNRLVYKVRPKRQWNSVLLRRTVQPHGEGAQQS